MKSASPYSLMSMAMPGKPRIDLNVFVLKFDETKNAQKNIGAGDPFFCQNCKVCLNNRSKIQNRVEYETSFNKLEKIVEVEQSNVKESAMEIEKPKLELGPNDFAWICEFCGFHNKIRIEKEEIPVNSDMVYILQSASQSKGPQSIKDSTIVLCIDNSGSMNMSEEVKGKIKLKHGISAHELQMLRQFMDPGDEAQLNFIPGQNASNTFISRKQCVMAAIESQLTQIVKSDPNKRVGIVTFNNEVVVIGDCNSDPKHILGEKLYKFDSIMEDLAPLSIKMPLKESFEKLVMNLDKIEASGATALGPAILSSIELASKGSPGSSVIICTDGLANIGLGSLDPPTAEAKQFYTQLALKAKSKNIVVNIVTIKGEGCKLEALSTLANQTNGNVSIVNPENLADDFSNILKDEVVGLNVNIKIRLPSSLRFRNELPENIKESGSILEKSLPNATVDTKVTFQYELKSKEELKFLGINPDKIQKFYFQAQITYTNTQGHKLMRVITEQTKATKDIAVVQKIVEMPVVHARIAQQSTAFSSAGDKKASLDYNNQWVNYMETNLMKNEEHAKKNVQFLAKNERANKAIKHKVLKEQIKEKKQVRKRAEEGKQVKPMCLSDEEEELQKELNKSLVDSDEDERVFHDFKGAKKFK